MKTDLEHDSSPNGCLEGCKACAIETTVKTKFEHDVDYCVEKVETIEELNLRLDDLRLGGLAHLEELHQFLTLNLELTDREGWNARLMLNKLEGVIQILRKEI